MNALERITDILERSRIDGGWIDEDVAFLVLISLGLNEDGKPADFSSEVRKAFGFDEDGNPTERLRRNNPELVSARYRLAWATMLRLPRLQSSNHGTEHHGRRWR